MELINNIVINVYSMAIVLIIYLRSQKDNDGSMQHKLFIALLYTTFILLIFDIMSKFDGRPDTFFPVINHAGNFLLYLFVPVLPSLWLMYVHTQIYENSDISNKPLLFLLVFVNVILAVLQIISLRYGYFYHIDSNNIYQRGPLYLLYVSITIIIVFAAFFLIIKNRKKIERNHLFSLIFFAVPPLICVALQTMFYGINVTLSGVVISLLIIFLDIQNQCIYTDYLTGVYNRKKLDAFLQEKISSSTDDKTFSTILIDLNNFKSINDMYGHDVGDEALQITVSLLKSCLSLNDFIARYGGDEFCIIMDISEMTELEKRVKKIIRCVGHYNKLSCKPFNINFGIGYAVYDRSSNMKSEDFLKLIDILMYKNKRITKSENQ